MQNILRPLLAVKTKKGYSVFSAVVVTLFSAWVLFDGTKVELALTTNGEEEIVKTHKSTVGELLEEEGIHPGEHDYLSHDEKTELESGMHIHYKAAKKMYVTIDGETESYYTTTDTVGEFLQDINIERSKYDEISHNESSNIIEGEEIKINKAFQVKVIDGKQDSETFWTTATTVEDFLDKEKIKLGKLDQVKPKPTKKLTKESDIEITRIEEKKKTEVQSIPYETKEETDDSLEKGKTKIVQEGEEGKIEKTYKITYENAQEVERELIDEERLEDPVEKIVKVGTKEVATTANRSSNSTSEPAGSGKVLTMEATGYGADCSGCSGITATGINIKANPNIKVVSVDPNVIPLGSRVWVEGYGEAIAGDTGGAIKGNRIDVLLPSEAYAASHWGRRTVKVKILD